MQTVGTVICYGHRHPPKDWPCRRLIGISRLYRIHNGKGFCRLNGRIWPLEAGKIYYIPYAEDFEPFSDPEDPILHSYADFELIPPLLTDRILEGDPRESEQAAAALRVFDAGAKNPPDPSSPFGRLCTGSILCLVSFIAEKNRTPLLSDASVLTALRALHADPSGTDGDLARLCFMDRQTLVRRFRKATGDTPAAYRRKLKLHLARRLREEGLTYGEIALRVGYADAATLVHALSREKKTALPKQEND